MKEVVRCEMEGWTMELRKYIELKFGAGVQHKDEISVTSRGLRLVT